MNNANIQKAAVLMLILGESEAAEVMKHLSPREVQKLGETMSTMQPISHAEINILVTEFNDITGQHSGFGTNSDEYVRSVLTQALGNDKASSLLSRILGDNDVSGIESLKWMDADSVAELIQNEHPQIITTILVHLERDQAAAVMTKFTDRLRNDVFLRIATLDGVQPVALQELNQVLTRLLSGNETGGVKKQPMGGTSTAADILNFMGGAMETSAMETFRSYDNDMAQKIMDAMFGFENLMEIDDRGIQLLLREVQSDSLIVALKGAPEELKNKILKNMSQRAADMLREDMESKGPVRVSEVEAQQKAILLIVRRLSDEGQIAMGGKGDDAFL